MTKTMQGTVHGNTIEIRGDLGMPDGQAVEVVLRTRPAPEAWGEGIRRSAGVAADEPGVDEVFEQIARERKAATFRDAAE